jgi:hypothetical protein
MKFKALTMVILASLLVGSVGFCFGQPNTFYGVTDGAFLNHLSFRNGYSATFLNDYTYGTAYETSGGNASYPNFWMIDGEGVTANLNLQLNTWFSSGVLNFTAAGNGSAEFFAPNCPTYMLGGPYDLSSGWNSGSNVWTLPMVSGVTYAAAFTRYWGDFYVSRCDSNITSLGWIGQAFTVNLSGAGGVLSVYTGSRNAPQAVTGLTSVSYNTTSLILSGVYSANSQVVLDWTVAQSSNPTPTPANNGESNSNPTAEPSTTPQPTGTSSGQNFITFNVAQIDLGTCWANQSLSEDLTFTFAGSQLTVDSITFTAPAGSWLNTTQSFPWTYTMGAATVNYTLYVPADASPKIYTGTVEISGTDPFGNSVSGSAPYTLTVQSNAKATSIAGISPLLIIVLVTVIAAVLVAAIISKIHR